MVQSRFEKLLAGLKIIHTYQPSAKFSAKGGYLYIGRADDQYITKAMCDHMVKLGFQILDGKFAFKDTDEKGS